MKFQIAHGEGVPQHQLCILLMMMIICTLAYIIQSFLFQTEACRKLFKRTEQDIDDELGEFLKHAPHRVGGTKYKVSIIVIST